MKYTNLRAFEKHLESAAPKHFSELYLIVIKDAFERKSAVDRLTHSLLADSKNPELSLKIFDVDTFSIDDVFEELNSYSFFAEKRMIALLGVDKLPKASLTRLEESLDHLGKSTHLIIAATSLAANTRFYKKAEQVGIILDIPEEKPWEKEKSTAEWLCHYAADLGKKLSLQIAQMIVKQIGTDSALLHQELKKLQCYLGERTEITPHDIGAISVHVNHENVWQLGESIFQRDAQAALRVTKSLLNEGHSLLTLLRQIRTQLQTEFQVCTILSLGGGSEQVTQKFPYMKGFILERHIQQAQGYGIERFKKGLQKIDEIEILAKSSGADLDFLAEILIIKLIV